MVLGNLPKHFLCHLADFTHKSVKQLFVPARAIDGHALPCAAPCMHAGTGVYPSATLGSKHFALEIYRELIV